MISRAHLFAFAAAAAGAALFGGCAAPVETHAASGSSAFTGDADRYFMMMFGYEDARNSAPLSHTFATFVHATVGEGGDVTQPAALETKTISWLPAAFDGSVCVDLLHLRCPAVTGHNYTLDETLGFARAARAQGTAMTIGVWGPYEVSPDMWNRASSRVAQLESGTIDYVANDFLFHRRAFNGNGGAVNCIHAVSDMMFFDRTGLNWGLAGSQIVANDARAWIEGPATYDFVFDALGVDTTDLVRESL